MIEPAQREIVAASVAWMDALFDSDVALLRHPCRERGHVVRESLWYATGRLVLDPADPLAGRIVDAVIALQFDARGAAWDGSWPRAPEEPAPAIGAVIWRDYDPNWRQFIGCLLGVLVRDFADSLGESRCARMRSSIARAINGEPPDRITAAYSNIALMQAWLSCEFGAAGARVRGDALANAIDALHRSEGGFREFNSPTYYGVDLWGLALWRRARTALLRSLGAKLEAALWRDVADFYHPGLRNLCGPFDRAYGVDMNRYAALLGLWLWWTCGDAARAFPDTSQPFGHALDFCAAPLLAVAPPALSAETRAQLTRFDGDRFVDRRIAQRTVTARLTSELMLGAVDVAPFDPTGQAMPITAHWRDASGGIGWLCMQGESSGAVRGAEITVRSSALLELRCSVQRDTGSAAAAQNAFDARCWRLGARRIDVGGIAVVTLERRREYDLATLRLPNGEGWLRFR